MKLYKKAASQGAYIDRLTAPAAGRKDKEVKKIIADGWHKWGSYDLYVEGGRVLRGTTKGWNARTVYPYKRTPAGEWSKGEPKLDTLKRSSAWKMM